MDRTLISLTTSVQNSKLLEITPKPFSTKKRLVKTWTTEQDQRLIALYKLHPKKWNIISQKMKNRNQNQCLHRFRRICRLGQNKKIWSPQEDQVVLKMIRQVGHNWRLIAEELGSKSGKQIRQRFINKLDPNIRREQWTEEEDMQIIELYSKMGSKWCEISKCLSGRPQNRIKNRFYSYIQKNYDFKIKDETDPASDMVDNKENTKQATGARVLIQSSKSSFSQRLNLQAQKQGYVQERKYGGLKVLQERIQNNVQKIEVKKEERGEWSYEKMDEEKENNQYNSLKEINDECFYKYSQNVNNSDLLYFEDN